MKLSPLKPLSLFCFYTLEDVYVIHYYGSCSQTFQSILCMQVIYRPSAEVLSKMAQAIYCLPWGFWAGCIIFVILQLYFLNVSHHICRRATYFTDSEIIKYFGKMCGWNSKSMKTKNYVRNYARYNTLKNHFVWFTLICS